jgi:hypothetical protein
MREHIELNTTELELDRSNSELLRIMNEKTELAEMNERLRTVNLILSLVAGLSWLYILATASLKGFPWI